MKRLMQLGLTVLILGTSSCWAQNRIVLDSAAYNGLIRHGRVLENLVDTMDVYRLGLEQKITLLEMSKVTYVAQVNQLSVKLTNEKKRKRRNLFIGFLIGFVGGVWAVR